MSTTKHSLPDGFEIVVSIHGEQVMSTTKHSLPDGFEIVVYSHGGIDVVMDNGDTHSVATTPEACEALAHIALEAAEMGRKQHQENERRRRGQAS